MTDCRPEYGKKLACGCLLGYWRCMACRPGLDLDQEKALEIYMAEEAAPAGGDGEQERKR
jgi:hypothetical protein